MDERKLSEACGVFFAVIDNLMNVWYLRVVSGNPFLGIEEGIIDLQIA